MIIDRDEVIRGLERGESVQVVGQSARDQLYRRVSISPNGDGFSIYSHRKLVDFADTPEDALEKVEQILDGAEVCED